MKRRVFIRATAAAMSGLTLAGAAHAQAVFPNRPVRLVIPSAPGGTLDIVGRQYAERMSKVLKQPVLIDNMAGAGTLLATRHVLGAAPDGHTLLMAANTFVTLPLVDKTAGYNSSDFTSVTGLSRTPMMLVVGAESPYKSVAELVAAAKKAPGMLTFASVGVGTTTHIPAEMFAQDAGIKLQLVPYKASPLALPDVVSGRVTFILGATSTVSELVKSGKLRSLAVTAESRLPAFPGVPTFSELGFADVTYYQWLGLFAPPKTPPEIRKAIWAAAEDAKKDPELAKRLEASGAEMSSPSSLEQYTAFLRKEEELMKKVVKEANIEVTR